MLPGGRKEGCGNHGAEGTCSAVAIREERILNLMSIRWIPSDSLFRKPKPPKEEVQPCPGSCQDAAGAS